jgi:chromosome segregation ATPase
MNDGLQRNGIGRLTINKTETIKGKIEVAVFDERFTMDDFTYVVDIGFKDLPNAIAAEDHVLRMYRLTLDQLRVENEELGEQELQQLASTEFFSDLANLMNQNPNSLASLRSQITDLNEQVEVTEEYVRDRDLQITEQLTEIDNKDSIIAKKDAEIEQLRATLEQVTREQSNQLMNAMQIITSTTSSLTT